MPVYEYNHLGPPCEAGQVFEVEQVMQDLPLNQCPHCGGQVQRLISSNIHYIKPNRSNAELRDAGFTKLVRKDDGIFENVTQRPGESKIVDRRKPETLPHLHKTIRD